MILCKASEKMSICVPIINHKRVVQTPGKTDVLSWAGFVINDLLAH